MDWLHNVQAAKKATIRLHGETYKAVDPQIIDAATAAKQLTPRRRRAFYRFNIESYLKMRPEPAPQRPNDSAWAGHTATSPTIHESPPSVTVDPTARFASRYGKQMLVGDVLWHYYRLGAGPTVLWLTGGLRRAAIGSEFLERLAAQHTVIAPDYSPVLTVAEFMAALDAILQAESVGSTALVGQSYGGMLAQAYLAHRPDAIDRIVLSSTGPADYERGWLAVETVLIWLAKVLPENILKELVGFGLVRLTRQLPPDKRRELAHLLRRIVHDQVTRADVFSHFAVAADLIRTQIVTPAAFLEWGGRVIVLTAENDPTQSSKDIPRYQRLFGRRAELISLGQLGHAAALTDPGAYTDLVERALA
ncbi:alpha/beta fold hydrolase [Mycobacterium sp. ML4]